MATKLTKIAANFSTTVLNNMSIGSSTGTLSSTTDKDGVALAAGKYCMIFNAGEANEEHLYFDLSGASMTNIQSVSRQGVLTANTQKLHNAGAPVKLTDFANISFLAKILTGVDNLDGSTPLMYDATPTLSDAKHLATKGYVDTNAVLTTGAQAVAGVKTFSSSPVIPDATASNQPLSKGQFDASAVVVTGNQSVSGIKTFSTGIVVPDATASNQPATLGQLQSASVAGGADASATQKGASKLSVAPVSSTNPIAVGDNDPRVQPATITNIGVVRPYASNNITVGTFTVTVASPAVFTLTAHGLSADDPVVLSTTGALLTGLTAGVTYYVISSGLTSNNFQLSATLRGSAINTSGTQSGVHTLYLSSSIIDSNDVYGDGADGDVTISGTVSLTKDTYYRNLTIPGGNTLNTNGWRLFVSGTLSGSGTLQWGTPNVGGNGQNGVNTGTATGGAGGAQGGSGDLKNVAGGTGGNGSWNAPTSGVSGAAANPSIGSAGVAGGNGGGAASIPSAGVGGTATSPVFRSTVYKLMTLLNLDIGVTTRALIPSGGAGGGAAGGLNGGGSSGNSSSGAGGGAGASGGTIIIVARKITGSFNISNNGANGGIGGNALNGTYTVGGGGGGAGGTGGVTIIISGDRSTYSGVVSVAGGTGGTAGTSGIGTATNGTNGLSGVVYYLDPNKLI